MNVKLHSSEKKVSTQVSNKVLQRQFGQNCKRSVPKIIITRPEELLLEGKGIGEFNYEGTEIEKMEILNYWE